jgi:hypothetical protein
MDKRFCTGYDNVLKSWYIYEDLTPGHKRESDSRYYQRVWVRDIMTQETAQKLEKLLNENSDSLVSFKRDRT